MFYTIGDKNKIVFIKVLFFNITTIIFLYVCISLIFLNYIILIDVMLIGFVEIWFDHNIL